MESKNNKFFQFVMTLLFGTALTVFTTTTVPNAQAQKVAEQGSGISADKFNSSAFQIGDVKHSLLTEQQFRQLNGDCWKLLDGSPLAGTDFGAFTGRTELPDARGRFVRNTGTPSTGGTAVTLGGLQEDSFKAHYHHQDTGYDGSGYLAWGSDTKSSLGISSLIFNHGDGSANNRVSRTSTVGANETRPKAVGLNLFIKVNKECNFE